MKDVNETRHGSGGSAEMRLSPRAQDYYNQLMVGAAVDFAQYCDKVASRYQDGTGRGRDLLTIAYGYNATTQTNLNIEPKIEQMQGIQGIDDVDIKNLCTYADVQVGRLRSFGQIFYLFGENIELLRLANNHVIKEHLLNIGLLPAEMTILLARSGVKITLGDSIIGGLTDGQFRNITKNPFVNKKYYADSAGVYSPYDNSVYAGLNYAGDTAVVLHELGHAFYEIASLDNNPIVSESHKRLYKRLRYNSKQESPGCALGCREFGADSFADFYQLPRRKFIARYDNNWYQFMNDITTKEYINL